MQKGFFWYVFFCFLVVLFFVACVFVLVFCKKGPKRLFSCNFRGFLSFLFPQKACLWNPFFFLSCFFSGFPFVFPFKTPFYPFAFWPSAPFWKTLIFLVSLSFFFLPFPFLMFACFFQTNFPNIPFLKPKLLSFWLFIYLLCCSCFFFCIVYVSVFCCYVGFVFGVFVLFCVFCFCSSFLFWFQSMKKRLFSLQFWCFFWVMLVKRVVWFLCFMLLFLFVFLVLFLSILKNSFVLFCFCVVVFLSQD